MNKKVLQKIEEADAAEGYFITITTLKDGRLSHYQRREKFHREDILPSLSELEKLVVRELN